MSTPAILIFPSKVSITSSELYIEVSEEDLEFWSLDPTVLHSWNHLHGKWHFSEIRVVFSCRYLLQNRAIELCLARS